jgi:uncharacterized membrane protein YgaE (UPF0421/DUF939 family)
MSQPLTTDQLDYLSSEYSQLEKNLIAYQSAHATDPDVDLAELQQCISDIGDAAIDLTNKAVATKFNDTAKAYASLTHVTEQANATAISLTKQRNRYSQVAKVAAAMIGLASALAMGNVAGVFSAIASCTQAATGHWSDFYGQISTMSPPPAIWRHVLFLWLPAMIAKLRFVCIAVGVNAVLILIADWIHVDVQNNEIFFAFLGIVVAIVVESVLGRRQGQVQAKVEDEEKSWAAVLSERRF